ncbi:MAG: hypothetical protein ABR538_07450 [Candidatus Binatia bacterium]
MPVITPNRTRSPGKKFLVPREEFRSALRVLQKTPLAGVRAAVITSRKGLLRIEVESSVCDFDVEGGWVGRAEVPARPFLALAKHLPKEDPLEIWIHEGILHIGSLWMKLHPKAQPPPLGKAERAHLHVRTIREFHELTVKKARASGPIQRHIPTKRDAERRVMMDCDKAAAILRGYGIDEPEIWRMVTKRIALLAPRLL